jgi:hypothetical protein
MDLNDDDGRVAELTEQEKTDIAKHVLDLSEEKINTLLENVSTEDAASFRQHIATCREIADVIPSVREKIKNTLNSKQQAAPVPVVPHVGVAAGGNDAGPGVAANAFDDGNVEEEDVDMGVDEANELKKRQNKILERLRRYIRAWDVIFHLKKTGYLNDTQQTFVLEEFVFAYILNDKKALNRMFDKAGSRETKKYNLPNVNADDDDYAKQIAQLVFSLCYTENEDTEKMISDEAIEHVLNSNNAYTKLSFMVNLYTNLTGDKTLQSLQPGSIDADNYEIEKNIGVVEGNNFDEDIAGAGAGGGDNALSQVSGSGSDSDSGGGSGSGRGASVRRGASLSGNGGGSGRSGRGSASASRGGDGENRAANVPRSISSAPSGGSLNLSRSRGSASRGRGSASRGAGGGSGVGGVENAEENDLLDSDWNGSFALQDDNVSTSSSAKKQRIRRSDEDNDQDQLVKAANEKLKLPGSTHPPSIEAIINKKNAQKPLSVLEMAQLREYASDFGGMIVQKRHASSSIFSGVNPLLASLSHGSVRSSSLVAVDPLRSAHAIDAANAVDVSHLLGAPSEEDEDVVENDISAAGGGGEGAAVGDKRNTEGGGSFAKRLRTRLSFPELIVEATSKLIKFNELRRSTQVSLKPERFNDIRSFTDAVQIALKGTETDDNRAVLEELLDINFPDLPVPKTTRPRKQPERYGFPDTGGRHFAMRAASFQRSRIAAILNSLYPIAV